MILGWLLYIQHGPFSVDIQNQERKNYYMKEHHLLAFVEQQCLGRW